MKRLLRWLKTSPARHYFAGAGSVMDISGAYFEPVSIPCRPLNDEDYIRQDFEAVERDIAAAFYQQSGARKISVHESVQQRINAITARVEQQ